MFCVGSFKRMLPLPGLPSETEIDGTRLELGQCLMASSQWPELFINARAPHVF